MRKKDIIEFDVRPILEGGEDPFKKIMEKLGNINKDQTLLIINKFEPVPLLNILKDKGYGYETERPEPGVVYTYLTLVEEQDISNVVSLVKPAAVSFEDFQEKYKGNLTEIDVRDLEMPLPMVTILEEIEKIDDNHALYVHHKRLPQYLIPELEKRGYKYVYHEVDESNIKLIIYK